MVSSEEVGVMLPGDFEETKGYWVKDYVCVLSELQCAKDVEFFAITGGWAYPDVYGLAPVDHKQAPSYIEALKNDKIIENAAVFLQLNANSTLDDPDNRSIVEFGMTKEAASGYVQGDWYTHQWGFEFDAAGIARMKLDLADMTYNGKSIGKDIKVMLASYSSYLVQVGAVYETHFNDFAEQITNELDFKCMKYPIPHNATENVTIGFCYAQDTCENYYSQLATFTVRFGEIIYTLPPKNLIYDHFGACFFNVFYNSAFNDEIMLGQPFIETFSMHFDYENDEVSFAQNVKAPEGASIHKAGEPIPDPDDKGRSEERV